MKKLCAAMTSCMLVISMAAPVLANEDLNVWIDENEFVVEEAGVTANVYSDGTNTDGQLVITYNADELSLTEEDVIVGENIEMFSANIVEEGTLKIAYLGNATDSEDTLFTINFDATTEELSDGAITIEGDTYNDNGDELTVGIIEAEEPTTPVDPEKPGDSSDTSDNSQITFYVSLATITLGLILAISFFSKKTKTTK